MAELALGSAGSQTCVSTGCLTSALLLSGAGHGKKSMHGARWDSPGLNFALGSAGKGGGCDQGDKQSCDWIGDRLMFTSEAGIKEETRSITDAALMWGQLASLWAQDG